MSIPLNIDWQQILLHLLNFAILTAGLYLLLYKPIKKFMRQRAAYYQQIEDEAKAKIDQAKEMECTYQQRLSQLEQELNEKRAKAATETQQAVDAQLQEAKEAAAKIVADAQETIAREHAKMLKEAQREISDMVVSATEKLAVESITSATYDLFLNEVERGEADA